MQHKAIPFDYWQRITAPHSIWSFGTVSPIPGINGPFFAYTWAGNDQIPNGVCTPVGTVIGCRIDTNDSLPLNLNYWVLYCIGSLNIVEIKDVVDTSTIPEHHWEGVPSVFLNAPEELQELILSKQENTKEF